MSPAGRAVLLLAGAAALACGDIGAPLRSDLYEWRLIVPTAGGPDTVNWHWAPADLPVRVWVAEDDIGGLPGLTQRAIDTWESQFLYGEFRAELVGDSGTADIIVRGTPAPVKAVRSVTRLRGAVAPECAGATDVDLTPDLSQLRLPFRVYIDPLSGVEDPALDDCLALTTIHELGHALGIFAHSPNVTDIMYSDPAVDLPSGFDRETAEALYHLPVTAQTVRGSAP
jgi:predicted Zn-dependent protease